MTDGPITFEVSLPADLVGKLDGLMKEFGLRSRSHLIEKLLSGVLDEEEIESP